MEKSNVFNFLRNKNYSSFKLAQNINSDAFIKPTTYNGRFLDQNFESCKLCCGTGFLKNHKNDISILNDYYEPNNKPKSENNINLTPYKLCISCYGTGKTDYNSVFYHTCCQKNTNTTHK